MLTTYLKFTFKNVKDMDAEKVTLGVYASKLRKIQTSHIFIKM